MSRPNSRKKAKALRMLADGDLPSRVAEALSVDASTVRRWRQQAAADPAIETTTAVPSAVDRDPGEEEDASLVEGSLRRAIVAAEDRGDHKATVAAAAAYSAHLARHGGSTGLDLVKAVAELDDAGRRALVGGLDERTVGFLHAALCERIAAVFAEPGEAS